jgi:CRP-like cAMP-binding protein
MGQPVRRAGFRRPTTTAGDHPSYLEIRWDVEKWMLFRLTNFGGPHSFGPADPIIREGEPEDGLYLILSGSTQVLRAVPGGEPRPLATLGPFRSFGEISLADQLRSATVVARTAALHCVELSRAQLDRGEQKEPKPALRLYRLATESLAQSLLGSSS